VWKVLDGFGGEALALAETPSHRGLVRDGLFGEIHGG